jgi:alkylation response protein AidB-like acyl-CoA dehydrogenase
VKGSKKEEQLVSRYQIDKALWGGWETFDQLTADIRARSDEFAAQHYVSDDIIERLKDIGIYRAFVPKEYGGDERTPVEFLLAIEALSEADGSAGWVASFGVCESYLGALPLEVVQETWKNPDDVFAGAMFPLQPAKVVDEGYLLNGRWKWASGCMSAARLGVGIIPEVEGALPAMAVFPAELAQIDTGSWDTHGMSGSGSFDLVLEDVLVPKDHAFIRGGPLTPEGTFFRYPTLALATQVLAVTGIGVAQAAINTVLDSAAGRVSSTGAPNLGDRPHAQMEMAKADARLRSARLFFYDSVEQAWEKLDRGEELDLETKSMMRLSCTHLSRECAEVARAAYLVSGMEAAEHANHLSRCFRDAHMPTQHAFMGEITFQNAGAIMFDRDPLPGYV